MKDFRSRFGFHTTPFTREISVSDRFQSEVFDAAIQGLVGTLEHRMSAAVIAASGTGKTTLLRTLIEDHLPEARYRVHYVKVADLSKRDLCREIAAAVGISPAGAMATMASESGPPEAAKDRWTITGPLPDSIEAVRR